MKKCFPRLLLFVLFAVLVGSNLKPFMGFCFENDSNQLINDLMIVNYWDKRLNERLPVTYNNFLQGGYLNMPSARMGIEGEIAAGLSWVPPYHTYNLRVQLIDRLELTGNYRVFEGIDDPILTPLGFGDLSDKGANFKLSLLCAEDSNYILPGLSIGMDDFMGTRNFKASYIVATKVFLDYGVEASLGFGIQRIRGFFGGISWMPFRKACSPYLHGISIVAEYDATPYRDPKIEKHPHGRNKKTPINIGLKYRLWDALDFSVCTVRGTDVAFSASAFYNFGMTKGLLPKINDPLPYKAPINTEPIGFLRPEDAMLQDFLFAFQDQNFDLLKATLTYEDCGKKTLRFYIMNDYYRFETEVRTRLDYLVSYLTPSNIDQVIVVIEADGFPIQEYHYDMEFTLEFTSKHIGPYELNILTPLCEVSTPCRENTRTLFKEYRDWYELNFIPRSHTLFGSAKGKFKYALGLGILVDGYLYNEVYYSLRFGYTFLNNMGNLSSTDRLNPSQLPNVRTDVIRYYKQEGFTLDQAYLQKNWNLGKGCFTRLALGYFEPEYAGIANEYLYYPVHSDWAVGIEAAYFKKRTVSGIGFTNKVRQLHGFVPSHHNFQFYQYFLNFYYNWREAKIDLEVNVGKFLANDYGARFEVARYFPSGLKIAFWYTVTNGNDKINGHTYYDKGISFSMPLDIFYTHSARARWGYGMSAWLRDVGYSVITGDTLYDLIREQRVR